MPMAQQVLDHADVDTLLQKMGGEAVPQRVDGDGLVQAGGLRRKTAGALQGAHRDGTCRIGPRKQEVLRASALPIGAENAEQLLETTSRSDPSDPCRCGCE